jgi:GNAT superfamily N-acetyltransferase
VTIVTIKRGARETAGKERRAPASARRDTSLRSGVASSALVIRAARPEDAERLWELTRGLAVYEKMENRVTGSAERLKEHLFGPGKIVDCLVAEQGGAIIGSAIYYRIYSTFRTQPMMWLEDIFVEPARRGTGAGRALIHAVAREAERAGCWRLSWAVLEWNEPAIGFYESLGAKRDDGGWYVYQFDEAKLRAIAGEADGN